MSANAIQSVSVQTSGFDADLGNAQSGVVNIVTKSGSDHYSSALQYRTDKVAKTNQKTMLPKPCPEKPVLLIVFVKTKLADW